MGIPRLRHGYDLVCVFDCLHDMGDPVGASRDVLETLDSDGTWMIVAPFANDRVEEPQPRRAGLLWRLDRDLHAGIAGPRGRPRAGSAGRRGIGARVGSLCAILK